MVALLASCTGGADTGSVPVPSTSRSTSPSPLPPLSAVARAARIGPHSFVRTCESSVYGELSRWSVETNGVRAGPLYLIGLPGYAHAKASSFRRPDGRLNGIKVLAVARREATLSVAPADRRHASLIYDPNRFNVHRVDRGDYRVRFEVCHPPPDRYGTQFNGGFLVDGVRCVALDVAWDGGARHRRFLASFGAGDC